MLERNLRWREDRLEMVDMKKAGRSKKLVGAIRLETKKKTARNEIIAMLIISVAFIFGVFYLRANPEIVDFILQIKTPTK